MTPRRVAVICGGRSSEHEVSLSSGEGVRAGLREAGHEVLDVRIERDGTWRAEGEELSLTPGRGLLGADAAFPVLHGPFGEDGSVQGTLECLDVPYVGAGVAASALCLDKAVFKRLMAQAGAPQVAHEAVHASEWAGDRDAVIARVAALGFPLWVKPARLGSSVGIIRVAEAGDVADALDSAFRHDPHVLVEADARGIEVECAVMGNDEPVASRPGEILLAGGEAGWYDYEAKYSPGGMRLLVPPRLPEPVCEEVRRLAAWTFRTVGCTGLARVDFFVDGDRVLVNELNTMPGFTPTSVFPKLFEASGTPYPELLDQLVALALERHAAERSYAW